MSRKAASILLRQPPQHARPNNFTRRYNLIRNISNWPKYEFARRIKRLPVPKPDKLVFKTRSKGITFSLPVGLLNNFRELFMDDAYKLGRFARLLPDYPTIVDVGANVGCFSLALLAKLDCARIFAYEPLPSNFEALKENVRRNPHIADQIEIFDKAIVGKPRGMVTMFHDGDREHSPVASLVDNFMGLSTSRTKVASSTLAEVYEDIRSERVDLLKLDCEGAEFDILFNTDPEILMKTDRLVLEVHTVPAIRHSFDELMDFIESAGFSTASVRVSESLYMVWASRVELLDDFL